MSLSLTAASGAEVTIYTDDQHALLLTRFQHVRAPAAGERLMDDRGDGEHVPADYALETCVSQRGGGR